jgi:hypothetical protein
MKKFAYKKVAIIYKRELSGWTNTLLRGHRRPAVRRGVNSYANIGKGFHSLNRQVELRNLTYEEICS